jgi:uncharacterized protein YjdB
MKKMKKIKFLISTLFVMFFIVSMTDVAYAFDYKITNKVVGETNDKSQEIQYILFLKNSTIKFNNVNVDEENGYVKIKEGIKVKYIGKSGIRSKCDSGDSYIISNNLDKHEIATGCRNGNNFPYKVYSVKMKNNTTLPISTSGSIIVICRVYDSSAKETNNQEVTYTMNSIISDDEDTETITSNGTMLVSDFSTADSIGLKGISDSTDGNVTIYNSDGSKEDIESTAKPKLNKTKATIRVGKTVKLKVTNYKNSKVTWSSSNKKVATVSSTGKVKGIKAGTATITAKVGKKSVKAKVTVRKKN